MMKRDMMVKLAATNQWDVMFAHFDAGTIATPNDPKALINSISPLRYGSVLWYAVLTNDRTLVQRCLDLGADPDAAIDDQGTTVNRLVGDRGVPMLEIHRLLLAYGARWTAPYPCPLHDKYYGGNDVYSPAKRLVLAFFYSRRDADPAETV